MTPTDFHATETLDEARTRCDAFARIAKKTTFCFDGRWNDQQFFHMISADAITLNDLPHIVHVSQP